MIPPALLVPIEVQALVVGVPDAAAQPGVGLSRDHARQALLGECLDPQPCFTAHQGLNAPGVHLHWSLPDGLTHGQLGAPVPGVFPPPAGDAPAPRELAFPAIPNRWLVVRLWGRGGAAGGVHCRAWVLESDRVHADGPRSWPGPKLGDPDPACTEDYVVHVGWQRELSSASDWQESPATRIRLTALGDGDPAFAAWYPACKGLLGFHDHDLGDLGACELSYLMVGWYAADSGDPLQQALAPDVAREGLASIDKLAAFLAERRWTFGGFDAAVEHPDDAPPRAVPVVPDRIVCHGLLAQVGWRGADQVHGSGVPPADDVCLGLGETAAEAFAALCRPHVDNELRARKLEAFQYDLLRDADRRDGDDVIALKLHERAFRPRPRGTRWTVLPPDADPTTGTPPLPGDVNATLAEVNARQAQRDALERSADAVRRELYASWYRGTRAIQQAGKADERAACHQALAARIRRLQRLIRRLSARRDAVSLQDVGSRLVGQLQAFLPGHRVAAIEDERFWRPNDPVVALSGRAFSRPPRHGDDGRFRDDQRLWCRLSDELITRVQAVNAEPSSLGPADLGRAITRGPFAAGGIGSLPAEVLGLLDEALLFTFDGDGAAGPAATPLQTSVCSRLKPHLDGLWAAAAAGQVPDLRCVTPDADAAADAAAAGAPSWTLVGVFPSAILAPQWRGNPWLPLFLHWEVTWAPAAVDPESAAWPWLAHGTTFDWQGRTNAGAPRIYQGSSLLAHSPGLMLAERLRRHPAAPDDAAASERCAGFAHMNILCTSLDGWTDRLLARHARMEISPLDLPAAGQGRPRRSVIADDVQAIDWVAPATAAEAAGGLLPLRAGSLALRRLWVVDVFGQVLRLEAAGPGAPAAGAQALPAPALSQRRVNSGDGTLWLDPRLAQAARLVMDWPPAGPRSAGEGAAGNPVCGWIVFNELYRGLMIYDARGRALGALQAVLDRPRATGGPPVRKAGFRWVGVPGGDGCYSESPANLDPTGPLADDANPHLRAFVNHLHALDRNDQFAWDQLFETMGEALAAGPGRMRHDSPLSQLIGRPLALVRARLRLELDGLPARGPDHRSGGVKPLEFAVQIGDRRWPASTSRAGPETDASEDNASVQPGDRVGEDGVVGYFLDGDYAHLHLPFGMSQDTASAYVVDRPVPRVSLTRPVELTLLMAPAAGVVVTSGILPRAHFHLPQGGLDEALEHKEVVFFTGPILSTVDRICMPEPADVYGEWTWTHHLPVVQDWREQSITDTQREAQGLPGRQMQLSDGWLKLVTAPLDIRDFAVASGHRDAEPVGKAQRRFFVEVDAAAADRATVLLTWTLVGADEICLERVTPDGQAIAPPVLHSQTHPLPRQLRLQLEGETAFRLTVASWRIPSIARAEGDAEPRLDTGTRSQTIVVSPVPRLRKDPPP